MKARVLLLSASLLVPSLLSGQGVTTAAISGVITDQNGSPLADAVVVAVHEPSGTQYRAVTRSGGAYNIRNVRVGGPYRVTVTMIGFAPQTQQNVFLSLAQDLRLDFRLAAQAVELAALEVTAEQDEVLNPARTGAATFIDPAKVALLPSVKRSTRDLIRLDPRNDGNYAFAGRNWLYNNISLDGSYFGNPFGLDDPAPGGQTSAEPVPYDAVEQVQVSVAPFDVRQGGFTGANINTVTKSGTNAWRGSAYTFYRNEALLGNDVRGEPVIANPDLTFVQSGVSFSGPLARDKFFFFVNAEIERTDDPGTNFVACTGATCGLPTRPLGVSRVDAATMDAIRDRLIQEYSYDPGPYQGYIHETDNDKLIAKLDWNVNPSNTLSFRYNYLNAKRHLPPHAFVLSFANSGRGPNESSLPFFKSGYAINNELNSFALELNSRSTRFANRFFTSYNRFRDFREPFSEAFPTIEIGQGGVTYTTAGHEPFSINNILDQDVWQFTNDFSLFRGKHVFTVGANFELFSFFNSFNIFRHGVFFLPAAVGAAGGTTFSSLQEFLDATDPNLDRDSDGQVDPLCDPFGTPPTNPTVDPCQIDFGSYVGSGPFKGEKLDVGQLALYAQDEFPVSPRFNLTYGLRVDFPIYFTDPIDNPFSIGLAALDENDNPETVDQAELPGATALFSPRIGFNWNAAGERRTQVRGGTGIFTGRIPFVWVGNVYSNPGENPNLFPDGPQRPTSDDATLAQSFDLNAMDPDFKWPQVWTTNIAIDQQLPGGWLGTLELVYGRDLNAVFMRNADLVVPVSTLPDGRPYYGGFGNNELNDDPSPADDGAGIYVIDNTDEGHNVSVAAQLRKTFAGGVDVSLGYSFTEAKNSLKSTEIASVLWSNQPVQGDPNRPELSFSEFGQRHRIVASATYAKTWSPSLRTQIGVFVEAAQGNRFAAGSLNRYSFIYSGDVNGDGAPGNDLIYIPRDATDPTEILFDPCPTGCGSNDTELEQRNAFNAFIEQDDYLREHRGEIAERFGLVNPWYNNVDLKILQDVAFDAGGSRHTFQLSVDVLNFLNLLNSDWGVRKVASAAATSPLRLVRFDTSGPGGDPRPVFNFTGPPATFIDDPGLFSRWRMQIGLRYLFN